MDLVDFGNFQRCYTGTGTQIPLDLAYCLCFDVAPSGGDGSIDHEDFLAFDACVSGPTVAADLTCDDP